MVLPALSSQPVSPIYLECELNNGKRFYWMILSATMAFIAVSHNISPGCYLLGVELNLSPSSWSYHLLRQHMPSDGSNKCGSGSLSGMPLA